MKIGSEKYIKHHFDWTIGVIRIRRNIKKFSKTMGVYWVKWSDGSLPGMFIAEIIESEQVELTGCEETYGIDQFEWIEKIEAPNAKS